MEDLVKEYNLSLAPILEKRREIKDRIQQLDNLSTTKYVRKADKLAATEEKQALEAEDKVLAGMQSDMEFAITWMKTGHHPGVTRGIERRAAYEIEKPFDPLIMQRYFRSEETTYSWDNEKKENVISRYDKELIDRALSGLTDREKETFILAKGYAMNYAKIGKQFNVSKQAISNVIRRAERKIGKFLLAEKGCESE
ncbi:sigma factor-like helix-turn-helix DNA-binding protein [Bacillus infantis]|uniref:sigma factor-like helix-turn-helix DNA-binding protein n=1 Tax=Bacillus infantis TaxID=324767 RepID=UPI003219FF5A